jgi:hypothetical protein
MITMRRTCRDASWRLHIATRCGIALTLLLLLGCETAADRTAEQERSRAIQEMHDRRVEYGELSEITAARSMCFLASPTSENLREFTRAVSEHRPRNIAISYGTTVGDCTASDIFVAYNDGRGVIFAMRESKMRMLGEKRTKSALVFARELLMILNGELPSKNRYHGRRPLSQFIISAVLGSRNECTCVASGLTSR